MKGIYVLIIKISNPIRIKVGALGEKDFQTGLYAYVGSAQSNLELRVKRHLRKKKPLFWHIDYLLASDDVEVTEVYYQAGKKMFECEIAQLLLRQSDVVPKFGCSDCHCPSHLFFSGNFSFLNSQMKPLKLKSQ